MIFSAPSGLTRLHPLVTVRGLSYSGFSFGGSMNKHDSALAYLTLGWAVFPLEWIEDGKCSCGHEECHSPGKHPKVARGFKDASTDPATVSAWWQRWPDANIGVATGEVSGIVVVDIDDLSAKTGMDLPRTVCQKTGSGGEHYIYRHPGHPIRNGTNILKGVDSRGDGGYIVAPPSNHIEGDYEWIEDPFDGAEMADCPDWWLEAMAKPKERQAQLSSEIVEGGRNTAVFQYGCDLWKAVPMDIDILFSAMNTFNLKKCSPPLDDEEVRRTAESIIKYEGMSEEMWNAIQSVRVESKLLYERHHQKIAEALIAKTTKTAGPPPEFMPQSGLIRDLAEYILSQSERPLEPLAVAASACFFGALFGRKFETWTGLGTNLMFVGLAESGSGKEKARKMIGKVAVKCGLDRLLGADDIASAPGLLAELKANPSKLFMLDEFGLALQSITGRNAASSKREIISTMMRLYSTYGGTYQGTAYADQKARPKVIIDNPCLVIYGTSTHHTFYDALTHDQGSDGFLARLLVVDCQEDRPKRAIPDYRPVNEWLRAKIIEATVGDEDNPVQVTAHPLVAEAWYRLDEEMTALMDSPQSRSIYSRVAENAIKLALVHCLSRDPVNPVIDDKDFVWGRDIALWCANYILEKLEEYVASNDTEKWQKKLIKVLRVAGPSGLSHRDLLRKCQGLKAWERDDILKTIDDMGYCFTVSGRVYHADYRDVLEGGS